jgi:alpha-glucosidase
VLLSSSGSRIGERPSGDHLALAGDEALVLLNDPVSSEAGQTEAAENLTD